MSKIKYSSQWQIEELESEYDKEMEEDYQQELTFSQENQFNDYQYDYYSPKDEDYYDKLKEIQRKIAKINHDNYKEFDNFFKSEDIFLKYWENIKKNYRIIYEIEKELIKMEEEIHPSLYMPAIIDDNKGEFQKFIDNLKKEIDASEKIVIDKLKSLKISENSYDIENLKIQPNYDKAKEKASQNNEETVALESKILNYDGQEIISIVTGDIDKAKKFYENLLELKLQSNNIEITKPEYIVTNIDKYKKDLLVDATKNAEFRAIEMLKVNSNEINGLKSMTQGQFEILKDNEDILNKDEEMQNQIYKRMRLVVTATYFIRY